MSAQTASFKVTLVSKDQKIETRRFVFSRNHLSSYANLRNKLKIVFQSIQSNPFKITWKDSDGDEISISSDEELIIAMKEMVGEVYRLTIEVLETQTIEGVNGGSVHSLVICDGCSGEIRAFRYVCVQCPNYELCPKCEVAEHHPEHFMVRIPFPMQWRRGFGGNHDEKARCATKHGGLSEEGDSRCPADRRYNIAQFFHQLLGNDQNTSQHDGGRDGEDVGRTTYLRTFGETVASLLDPLGIDVGIEVETKENCQEVNDRESPLCCHGANSSDEEMMIVNDGQSVTVLEPEECLRKASSATSDEKENPIMHCSRLSLTGGGDSLMKMPEPMHTPAPPAPTSASQDIVVGLSILSNCQGQVELHSPMRSNVVNALNTMTAMGFQNESGWLSYLLESVNGDIHKALDIMQPVKK